MLVSHANVPEWEPRAIRNLVRLVDLYTSFSDGTDTDEFETFITRQIEEPGQKAIERLLASSRLRPADWQSIAKFVAAQQLRTPLYFVEYMRRAKSQLEESLETAVRNFEANDAVQALKPEPSSTNFLRDLLKVAIESPADGSGQTLIRAEIKSPRTMWMDAQRHHLTKNVRHICAHHWRAAEPAGDEEWPLTDHPVLTLNFYGPNQYDFDAGWNKAGSEFFMPISPRLGVYTQVGARGTGRFAFSAEQTETV